jgi:hypothetical protein
MYVHDGFMPDGTIQRYQLGKETMTTYLLAPAKYKLDYLAEVSQSAVFVR